MRLLVLLSVLFLTSQAAILCPRGFTIVNNRCIRIFSNTLKHRDAETDCTYLGGTLVNIKNSIDNRAIATKAANAGISNLWIGVFCFASNSTNCYYDDASGTASNYTNFAAGNPQVDQSGSGGCVYMSTSSGQWLSAKCDVIKMSFVCEVPYTVPDDCNYNYNGNCYYPSTELNITSVNMTHDRAESICASKSMNLVSIHSKLEHDYIRSVYRSMANSGSLNLSQIYIGAKASLPDTFDWDDLSNWDFEYLNPLASSGKGNCLVMDLWGAGLWSEVNCQQANYFMCKRAAGQAPDDQNQEKSLKESSPKIFQFDTDFSNCNATFLLAPGVITSPDYPATGIPSSACTYALRALGPYRIGIYFTDFHTNYNRVDVYDEFNNHIGSYSQDIDPFSLLAPTNIVRVEFSIYPFNNLEHGGFSATFLPIS